MATVPRPIETPPDLFDGSAAKAIPFWNLLANYYGINTDLYTTESRKVAAALTHFKLGTSAGDWASDQLSTALAATPVNYGTWAAFKTAFERQFIPPQTQVEAIQKIHNLPMGNREFNEWYQEWSMHAQRANMDEQTKMFAFRKVLNQSLHSKIVQLSPQPTTLNGLVEKARDIDQNWRMFTGPMKQGTSRIGQRRPNVRALEENPDMEINVFQGKRTPSKKRGKLSPAERKHRLDNNLCLYCGKPGHKASECTAPPNRFPRPPNTSIRRIDAIPEEEPQAEKSDINMIDSNQFGILASLDPSEMNVTSDF